MKEPIWILKRTVLALHLRQLAEHGGQSGVRDEGLLESALERPRNQYNYNPEADLAQMAASYAFGIARNHPFLDGNKRTALVTCLLFLEENGERFEAKPEDLYKIFYDLGAGKIEEDHLAQWIRDHLD